MKMRVILIGILITLFVVSMIDFSTDININVNGEIVTSTGMHYTLTGENLHTAIADIGHGTIWVGGDIRLTEPLKPKDYTHIDFLGNNVHLDADIPFLHLQKAKYNSIKNAIIHPQPDHTASIIYLYIPEQSAWADRIWYNTIQNIHIYNKGRWIPQVGWENHDYTGIHFHINGTSSIALNQFEDISMNGVQTGILLQLDNPNTAPTDGWGNGNLFRDIYISQYVVCIDFQVHPNARWGFNRNVFDNVKSQTFKYSTDGIRNIYGAGNHFFHTLMWDWHVADTPNYYWSISSKAVDTKICEQRGHQDKDTLDNGIRTDWYACTETWTPDQVEHQDFNLEAYLHTYYIQIILLIALLITLISFRYT